MGIFFGGTRERGTRRRVVGQESRVDLAPPNGHGEEIAVVGDERLHMRPKTRNSGYHVSVRDGGALEQGANVRVELVGEVIVRVLVEE